MALDPGLRLDNDEADEETDTALAGIHVFKQSDLVEESLFRGNFVRMACPEDSEYIVDIR